MIDEELGGSEIAGKMKRRAAVAALGLDQRRIGAQQIGQAVNETEGRGCVDAERGAARHKEPGDGGRNVIGRETVGPGLAETFRQLRIVADQCFDAREGGSRSEEPRERDRGARRPCK
jgi:hypothetical protein